MPVADVLSVTLLISADRIFHQISDPQMPASHLRIMQINGELERSKVTT